jgi:hypothetical protein
MRKVENFSNGYGYSLIENAYSYGLELAVLKDGQICYDTPITNDVIGHLTMEEANGIIERIKALPQASNTEEESRLKRLIKEYKAFEEDYKNKIIKER